MPAPRNRVSTSTTTRGRGRASGIVPANTAQIGGQSECLQLLADFWVTNTAANAATRKAKAAKEKLHKKMLEQGFSDLRGDVAMPEGSVKVVSATIAAVSENYVDVKILKEIVPEEMFLQIVKATQEAVTAAAGSNVLARALRTRMTDPRLTVAEVRD